MTEIPLEQLFGVPSGTRYVYVRCPVHGDEGRPNLAVYRDGTYCFVCGYHETPEAFLNRIQRDPSALLVVQVGGSGGGKATRPDWSLADRSWRYLLWEGGRRERQAYLSERGLSLRFCQELGLGHTGQAFSIPYRDRQGRLLGFKFRADPLYGAEWRYRNSPGLGTQLFRPKPTRGIMVVVEGELDALLLAQYGVDAWTVSTGAGGLARGGWWEKVWRDRSVVVALDWDQAGERAAGAILARCPNWVRASPPGTGKDVTEWLTGIPVERRGVELERVLRVWSSCARST